MSKLPEQRLSEIVAAETGGAIALDAPTGRRAFLARASVLSLAIPSAGALLTACEPSPSPSSDTGTSRNPDSSGTSRTDSLQLQNANSRLDTALAHPDHGATSAVPGATQNAASTALRRFSPELPPLSSERTLRLQWTASEVPVRISNDTVVAAWTFEGDIPGPIVHFALSQKVNRCHSPSGQSGRVHSCTTAEPRRY